MPTSGPRVTTDCVVSDDTGRIALIRRRNDPFKNSYALPGGFVDAGETVESACIREVKEETGLDVSDLRLIGVYSEPRRDPRGHVISIAFAARADLSRLKAGDDAAAAEAVGDWRALSLAFDHRKIIEDCFHPALPGTRTTASTTASARRGSSATPRDEAGEAAGERRVRRGEGRGGLTCHRTKTKPG